MRLKRDDNINCEEREANSGLDVMSKRFQRARIDLRNIHPKDRLTTNGSDGSHVEDSRLTAMKLAGRKIIVRYEI